MDTQLYLRVRGRVLGPYDQEKLQLLARRGQLSRMHEVSTDGTHWVRASTYTELFVGDPVKIGVQEMQVAPPPPAQQTANEPLTRVAEEVVTQPATPLPVTPAAAARSWYYEHLGAQYGPVEESLLRQMLATGQLEATALVWADGVPQWVAAAQIPGLVPPAVVHRGPQGGGDREPAADDSLESLCNAARASRPWALFLAVTAFVYACLCILFGFVLVVQGADRGAPPAVAMGLFSMVSGVVTAAGGILLSSYASRLASLTYRPSCTILASAMERLKTFWMFVSICLIVTLAFIGFFTIWIFAMGVGLAHYIG
jgi:hypothetical protein